LKIVWDEPKRLANLDKHGLNFADLNETFFDNALVITSHNKSKRWVAIGVNIRGVVVVVFARLGREGVSIISMRPVSRSERKLYAERKKEIRLQQKGPARSQRQSGADQGGFRQGPAILRGFPRSGRIHSQGARPKQIADKKTCLVTP
jgi:hypothetical protein